MSSEVDTFGDEIQLTEPEDKGEKEKTATSNGNGTPSAEGQEPRVYANENMGSDEDAEDESEGVDDESEEDEDGDVPELPSAEEQKQAMSKLDSQCPMKEGDQWYLVHFRWWQLWKTYTDYKEPGSRLNYYASNYRRNEPPDEIDNSFLLTDQATLRRDVREISDYHLLHEKQWKLLIAWYGGGPEISRKVIKSGSYYGAQFQVEVHLLRVNLVRSTALNDSTVHLFSKRDHVRKMMEKAIEIFGVEEENIRLWDYHGETRLKLLDDLDSFLSDHQIMDRQKVLIEEKDADGKWPAVATRYSGSTSYTNQSYAGSSSSSHSSYYNRSYYDGTKQPTTPGLCGLTNIGNTCFMNSAIQCLSNSDSLRKFFTSKRYENDINTDNPLGSGGELVNKFAELMKIMWGGDYSCSAPRDLKSKIERNAPQFGGYSQHDSQELLMYLMDGIHEDVNRVKRKEAVPTIESDGRPDEVVAKEAWEGHLKRNDSVVVDLFHGQLKSKLDCPHCDRVSITFDPISSLSVPVPVPKNKSQKLVLVWKDPSRIPLRIRVDVPKTGKISDLKKAVSELIGIPQAPMYVAEVYSSKFYKEFVDEDSLVQIREGDFIYAFELEEQPTDIEDDKDEEEEEEKPQQSHYGHHGSMAYYNSLGHSSMGYSSMGGGSMYNRPKRFPAGTPGHILHVRVIQRKINIHKLYSIPTVCSVPKTVTYRELYKKMVHSVQRRLFKETQQIAPFFEEEGEDTIDYENPLFRMVVTNDMASQNKEVLKDLGEKPVLHTYRKENIFIVLEWETHTLNEVYDGERDDPRDIHESYSSSPAAETTADLQACLSLFSKPEVLSPQDSWYCSQCKDHVQATKTVEVYSCPESVIIHFKRFASGSSMYDKIDRLIDFPTKDLDMTPYLVNKLSSGQQPIYDLYGVINHFGGMGGGHYTAYAKSSSQGKWYQFDDSSVSETSESSVVTRSAYVLFYRRKDAWNKDEDGDPPQEEEEGDSKKESDGDDDGKEPADADDDPGETHGKGAGSGDEGDGEDFADNDVECSLVGE